MARTKQTARLSTGGHAPRRQIARKAARREVYENDNFRSFWKVRENETVVYMAKFGHSTKNTHTLRFTRDGFHERFNWHIRKLLDHLQADQELTKLHCYHLGLTDSVDDENPSYNIEVTEQEWNITQIWLSSGTKEGEEEGAVYALRERAEVRESTEEVHPIRLYTLRFTGEPKRRNRTVENGRFWIGRESQVSRYYGIYVWLLENEDKRLVLDHAGARGVSLECRMYHCPGPAIGHFQSHTKCLFASMANAMLMHPLLRRAYADRWWDAATDWFLKDMEDKNKIAPSKRCRDIRDLQKWHHPGHIVLYKVRDPRDPDWTPSLHWIDSRRVGIFLVELRGMSANRHCICVDAHKRIILDSAEPKQMVLSVASLKSCVGEDTTFSHVTAVREFNAITDPFDGSSSRIRRHAGEYDLLGNVITPSRKRKRAKQKKDEAGPSSHRG